MRSVAIVLYVFLYLMYTVYCSPLDLGYGGVYDSPEANAYWARRFGGFGHFSRLVALQEGINAAAARGRP